MSARGRRRGLFEAGAGDVLAGEGPPAITKASVFVDFTTPRPISEWAQHERPPGPGETKPDPLL